MALPKSAAYAAAADMTLTTPQSARWFRWTDKTYRARVVQTDVIVGMLISFSFWASATDGQGAGQFESWTTAVTFLVVWLGILAATGVWDARVLGRGIKEFRNLGRAAQFMFCVIAVLAYVTKVHSGHRFILLNLPLGLLVLLLSHLLWRRWLVGQRKSLRMLTKVLVVGDAGSALYLARRLQAAPESGYRVAGLCIPIEECDQSGSDFRLVGTLDEIPQALERTGAGAVAVASCDHFGPAEVHSLAWQLEGTGVRLILTPSLVDVAGPRIHIKQVAGLPLMQVEAPRFRGPRLVAKAIFDVSAAALGLLLLSPALLIAAIAIKLDDGGPVFFRQARVGLDGRTFVMWKFRSMFVDADRRLADLRTTSQGNGVLFKMKNDPRITRVGGFFRRFSIDELPQLLNVLTRTMSLVGPRPPLVSEVALYGDDVHRRFLVKPGLTGLWQVGGRSDLTWDETVRLDLYYVENWSMAGDIAILARTAGAVLGRSGAY